MPRQFNFSEAVKRDARLRQMELCAYCGDSLNEQSEEAHHVVPDQSGEVGGTRGGTRGRSPRLHQFLRLEFQCRDFGRATSHLYPAEESTDGDRDDQVNVVNVPKLPI